MPQLQPWARVRAQTTYPLRRGAWYRVVGLTPLDAILEVRDERLSVPRAFLQIVPMRPLLWSVVSRRRGGATGLEGSASPYAVCPACSARAALDGSPRSQRCGQCQAVFKIGWSDSYWRVFEIPSGGYEAITLAQRGHVAQEEDR
jgi:hypothetical protein